MNLPTLLLLIAGALAQDGALHRAFLMYPSSFVNLTANEWKLTDDVNTLLIAVKMHQKTHVGQIFSARLINQHGSLEAILTATLRDLSLFVEVFDANYDALLDNPLINDNIGVKENNVMIELSGTHVSYRLDDSEVSNGTGQLKRPIETKDTEIVVTLGGGQSSMIGCATLMALSINGAALTGATSIIDSKDTDECPPVNECSKMDCFKGICKLLEVPTCDCYHTQLTGPNCREKGQTARIRNNDDEEPPNFIRYTPWPDAKTVDRIAIDFKFGEHDEKEGVLVYGITTEGLAFKIFVVGLKGQVVYGSETEIDFDLQPDSTHFHTIIVKFRQDSIKLLVDLETYEKEIYMENSFVTIQFGAPIGANGAVSEIGVTACLKEVYVDHYDILNLMYNEDRKINSTRIRPCSSLEDPILVPGPPRPDYGVIEIEDEDEAVNTSPSDSESLSEDRKSVSDCDRMDTSLCLNGATCFKTKSETVGCSCKDGFVGKFCQFSTLPRSCAEAKEFHGHVDGVTRLDVDGSLKLEPNVALCKDGKTIVSHDMTDSPTIRSSVFNESSLFVVAYRDFKRKQLQRLIKSASECVQKVTYTCDTAPLHFSDQRTWFNTTFNVRVTQLGDKQFECGSGSCECDSGARANDEGILRGRHAGITEIVTIHNPNDGIGALTLGELVCEGFEYQNSSMRFVKRIPLEIFNSSVSTASFQFRTNDENANLVTIGTSLRISIDQGSSIKVHFNNLTSILVGKTFNDGFWHLLILEFAQGELRVSVDNARTVLEGELPEGPTFIGSITDGGFIGCLRSLRLNDEPISLAKFEMLTDDIQPGCESHCEQNSCFNGGKCLEDFENDRFKCLCDFPEIQEGNRCESVINEESSVTLLGGQLIFESIDAPLTSNIFFSFRTDQETALLYFSHDHNNNFLQVHLGDESQLVLTLNNGETVWSCVVQASAKFADMEWHQVVVRQSESSVSLHVDKFSCVIQAPRALADAPVTRFDSAHDDVVRLPVGVHSQPSTEPFVVFLLGGIVRKLENNDGSLILSPKYDSPIPNLLGCLRGVRIGKVRLDLRAAAAERSPEEVKPSCDVDCGQETCKNQGHCGVEWKSPGMETKCSCQTTGYSGSTCSEDEGVSMSDGTFSFDIGDKLGTVIVDKDVAVRQTIRFSFSIQPGSDGAIVSSILFKDSRVFEVVSRDDGSLVAQIYKVDGQIGEVQFDGNFSDGYRHLLVARIGGQTVVTIDRVSKRFEGTATKLNLFDATKVAFGWNHFSGCISEAVIDFNRGEPLTFRPISSFYRKDRKFMDYISVTNLKESTCPEFKAVEGALGYLDTAEFPVWDTNFQRHIYRGPVPNETSCLVTRWILYIVYILAVILLIVFVCLFLAVCCRRRRRNTHDIELQDVFYPFRTAELNPPEKIITKDPVSDYLMPEPDKDLSREPPSNDEFASDDDDDDDDETIRHIDEDLDTASFIVVRPDELQPRRSPQRVSSFKNDSTAPSDSPLYSPKQARTPPKMVSIPVPPPRTSSNLRMREYLSSS